MKTTGKINSKTTEYDIMPLADGISRSFNSQKTGLNNMRLVVGSTGCGKTMSITIPQILESFNQSIVVSLAKKENLLAYRKLLEGRGYKTEVIDLSSPDKSTIGYDPFKYVKTPEDVLTLSKKIVNIKEPVAADPYWNDSAQNMLSAFSFLALEDFEEYVKDNPDDEVNRPTFEDILSNINALNFEEDDNRKSICKSNFDTEFKKKFLFNPLSKAYRYFKPFMGGAYKTHMCTYSTLVNALNKTFSQNLINLMVRKNTLDISSLGKEKTALFIISDPICEQGSNFANLLYSDIFSVLFKEVREKSDGKLDIPVHIICDDFACTSKIEGFERYISVIRASGISATLLLQDFAQLNNIYGTANAQVITSNCDTILFMGSMDNTTCKIMGEKLDIPSAELMAMPRGKMWVLQRGEKPLLKDRYKTFMHPDFIKINKDTFLCPEINDII